MKKEYKNNCNGKFWFSADRHHGHANILFLGEGRMFKTIEDHDQTLIANHNSVVSEEDTTVYLGDWSFRCSPEYATRCLEQSNGKFIFILGNHEKPLRQAYKMGLLNNMLDIGKLIIVGEKEIINDPDMYIGKVFHIQGYRIFASHCATRSWPHAFKDNTMHLHGHSHNRLGMFYKSMDVGVDASNPKYYPISFETIKTKMDAIAEPFTEDGNFKYKQDNEEGKE